MKKRFQLLSLCLLLVGSCQEKSEKDQPDNLVARNETPLTFKLIEIGKRPTTKAKQHNPCLPNRYYLALPRK